MSIRVGTSLSSLSMEQLQPKKSRTKALKQEVRIASDSAIKERQKAQQMEQVNAGKRKSSDIDEFFLKFTEHRDKKVSENLIKLAKLMRDTKDTHIITTHGDSATNEMKKIAEKFDIPMDALRGIDSEAKGDALLSAAAVEKLAQQYDVNNMTEQQGANLLAELAGYGAISFKEFLAAVPLLDSAQGPVDFLGQNKQMSEALKKIANSLEQGGKIYSTGMPIPPHDVRERAAIHEKIATILASLAQEK